MQGGQGEDSGKGKREGEAGRENHAGAHNGLSGGVRAQGDFKAPKNVGVRAQGDFKAPKNVGVRAQGGQRELLRERMKGGRVHRRVGHAA